MTYERLSGIYIYILTYIYSGPLVPSRKLYLITPLDVEIENELPPVHGRAYYPTRRYKLVCVRLVGRIKKCYIISSLYNVSATHPGGEGRRGAGH